MSEYNERFIGLGSLSTYYPFHSLCFSLSLTLFLFWMCFKHGKRDEMQRCMPISYAVLLFDSNGSFLIIQHQLTHRTHRYIGEYTLFTISFWITIYHSPLAIASFVSKTFILHFIKLEIIFRINSIHWQQVLRQV